MDSQPGPSRIKDDSPERPQKKYKTENVDFALAESKGYKGSKTIDDLPDEIVVHILSYLSVPDRILNAQKVCCKWHQLMKRKVLWRYVKFSDVSTSSFIEILEYIPSVVLHFEYHCEMVTILSISLPRFMAKLHERCPSLKTLILENMYFLQRDDKSPEMPSIPIFSQNCKRFQAERELEMEFLRFYSERSLKYDRLTEDGLLRVDLPELQTLLLREVFFNPYHLYYFSVSVLPKITVLDLSYSQPGLVKLTEQELFTTLVDLEELYLIGWKLKNHNILTFIQNVKKLKVLDLGFTSVSDSAIFALQRNSLFLEELYLCATNIMNCSRRVEGKDFFPRLQSLCVRETHITERCAEEYLNLCPSLKFFNINCCKNLTKNWYDRLHEDFQKKVNFIFDYEDQCYYLKRTNSFFPASSRIFSFSK